jgi:hypothetical protein
MVPWSSITACGWIPPSGTLRTVTRGAIESAAMPDEVDARVQVSMSKKEGTT